MFHNGKQFHPDNIEVTCSNQLKLRCDILKIVQNIFGVKSFMYETVTLWTMTVFAENIGFICLILSVAAILISFVTPYWIVATRDPEAIVSKYHLGLLAYCEPDSCEWLLLGERQFQIDKYPDWFKAVQGLMSVGLALGLIALLVTTLSLCCTCHSCNPHQTISGFMLSASVSMAVGIVVFGVKAHDDWGIEIEKNIIGFFGWSFWVGVGATALALLTSFVYCCMGRNDRH